MLARAFQDDPAWVWLIPDAERRARVLPWLFRVGFDVTAADVWATPGPVLGAARWMPPGRAAMRVGPTLRALVTTPLRLGTATGSFLAYGGAVEALRAEAMPGRALVPRRDRRRPVRAEAGDRLGAPAAGSRSLPRRTGCRPCS